MNYYGKTIKIFFGKELIEVHNVCCQFRFFMQYKLQITVTWKAFVSRFFHADDCLN